MNKSDDSFFDFDGGFDSVDDMLNESYAGAEDSGEGDTAAFFSDITQENSAPQPQQKEELIIETEATNEAFAEDIAQLDNDILGDLDDLKTIEDEPALDDNVELFVSKENTTPMAEPVAAAEENFNLDNIDSDELLNMLEETNETETSVVENVSPVVEETVEEITPLYEEVATTPETKVTVEETVVEPVVEPAPPVAKPAPPVAEQRVEDPVVAPVEEKITPLYEEAISFVTEVAPVQETKTVKVVEEVVGIPSIDTLERIVEILDMYADFTEKEKEATLLLLYADEIDINARDEILQKILSVNDEERLTIKTLKDLKELDSVECAFSLMDLPDVLLSSVSKLVYYISGTEMPTGETKINLSRDVVKHIEKLNDDMVEYFEKTIEIISI